MQIFKRFKVSVDHLRVMDVGRLQPLFGLITEYSVLFSFKKVALYKFFNNIVIIIKNVFFSAFRSVNCGRALPN